MWDAFTNLFEQDDWPARSLMAMSLLLAALALLRVRRGWEALVIAILGVEAFVGARFLLREEVKSFIRLNIGNLSDDDFVVLALSAVFLGSGAIFLLWKTASRRKGTGCWLQIVAYTVLVMCFGLEMIGDTVSEHLLYSKVGPFFVFVWLISASALTLAASILWQRRPTAGKAR